MPRKSTRGSTSSGTVCYYRSRVQGDSRLSYIRDFQSKLFFLCLEVPQVGILSLLFSCGFQVHIVQRGAVRPLIRMLEAADPQLREMAAFALGRLAQVVFQKRLGVKFSVFQWHMQVISWYSRTPIIKLELCMMGDLNHCSSFWTQRMGHCSTMLLLHCMG